MARPVVNQPINRRGQGTVWKQCEHTDWSRCDCAWRIRYYDASNRQKQESVPGKQSNAWDRLSEIKSAKASGDPVKATRRDTLFGSYCDTWHKRRRSLGDSSSTLYEQAIRLHLKPAMGEAKRLHTINRQTLFDLVDTLEGSGMSPAYIKLAWSNVLLPILRSAAADGLMDSIDLAGIELPEIVRKEIYVPTFEEMSILQEDMGFVITLMAGCGLRIGEALASHDRCYHDDLHLLRINEQWRRKNSLGPLKHRRKGQYRDIPLPAFVIEQRDKHLSKTTTRKGYHFPSPVKSEGLLGYAGVHRKLDRAVTKHELNPEITLHTFRHFFVAHALEGGSDLTAVAKWLGHQNIQITYGTYGHLLKPTFDRAAISMDHTMRGEALAA